MAISSSVSRLSAAKPGATTGPVRVEGDFGSIGNVARVVRAMIQASKPQPRIMRYLSVVTMPDELFYPAAPKQMAAIIVKKGTPHPKEQDVFWARIEHDGHLKVKSKRLPAEDLRPPRTELDQVPTILPPLRAFIASPGAASINVPRLCKTAPIDYGDPLLELLPDAYVDSE